MTRDDDEGAQASRRSTKDNRGKSSQRDQSRAPVAKRRSPVGGGSNGAGSKSRAPQGSTRRAKQVSGSDKGRVNKGSSSKRARSRS